MALNWEREQEAIVDAAAITGPVRTSHHSAEEQIGKLSVDAMVRLKDALAFALDLQNPSE